MVKVSLFASAVRPKIWPAFFNSLDETSVEYEVVFAGNNGPSKMNNYPGIIIEQENFKYINTGNLKPSQCYEIARRHCIGEVVVWVADDCEFSNNVIGKAYDYWKSKNNKKLILSIQTRESGYGTESMPLFDMNTHRFYGGCANTPLMAPLGMMSREFLNELGGLDQRYTAGQYENDIVCRAYQHGATVEIFGDENCCISIDHLKKSIEIGESASQEDFINRPFAKGYKHDREVLEKSWTTFDPTTAFKRLQAGERPFTLREVSPIQLDEFQPYPENISLTKSHGPTIEGVWE